MKHSFKYVFLSLLCILYASISFAQVTTSSLGGRVVDQAGEPVIGAAILAKHEPSGTTYGAITNLDGRFTIQGMRTGGPYKVEITSLGYQAVTYTGITLKLGELYRLNVTLKEANEKLNESIVIATHNSKFAGEKTGAATNISRTQLQLMPTVNRSVSDIAKMSPYGGNGMNLAGSDGRSANFTVDGANFNNNFGLNSALPGGGNPISLDAIEEMQVVVSPFDVRQSNFLGGGINAITKSGTNNFKGSAYVYYRNQELRGNKIDGQDLGYREPYNNTTYGFTLGGPIIKNKLFFFTNVEYIPMEKEVNRWRGSKDGVADEDKYISRTTLADLEKVSKYLKTEYNYDAGSYTSYPGKQYNFKALARIDWNITSKHHLALRYNYTTNEVVNSPNYGSSSFSRFSGGHGRLSKDAMAFSNSMFTMNNSVQSLSFDLNSRFNNNISNQFLATFSYIKDKRNSNSKPFPFVDIMDGTNNPYMSFGYELFTWNNAVNNFVVNVKDDITYYLGNHKITAGLSFEHQMVQNSFMQNGAGYYRYNSMDDFLNKLAPIGVALTYGYGKNTHPFATVSFDQYGAFVQDEWNIVDNFKLNAGIRADAIVYYNRDLLANNAIAGIDFGGKHINVGRWPKTRVQVSPRIGFTWDILGNNSLKLRGGTGLFAGRLPLVFFTNMPTNSNMLQNIVAIKDKNDLANFAGDILTQDKLREKITSIQVNGKSKYPSEISSETATLPWEINGIDPKFQMPQVWKSSIALDYQLPTSFPMTLSGEFIFNKVINGVQIVDWNINDKAVKVENIPGAGDRRLYKGNYTYSRNSAYVLTNTNKGYGYTANVTLTAEPFKRLSLMASYTYTCNKELTGMPGNRASSVFKGLVQVNGANFATLANSQYLTPHRLIASLTYKDDLNNTFSLFYEGATEGVASYGTPGSFTYGGDINGDGNRNDLIYIPKDRSELVFQDNKGVPASVQADNFWNFVNSNSYLKSRKGKFAEAYSVFSPMIHRIDFRYTHDFKFKVAGADNVIQLSVDCMNIGNLINSSWGVGYKMSSTINNGILLNREKSGKYTSAVQSGAKVLDYVYNPSQAWYLQLGIRYKF